MTGIAALTLSNSTRQGKECLMKWNRKASMQAWSEDSKWRHEGNVKR